MDNTAKQQVKDALKAQAERDLASLGVEVSREHSAAELDQTDSFSVDDLSQSDDAGDFVGIYEGIEDRQKAVIATIDALDVSLTDTVRPGAIVAFDGSRYVVGVVAESFDCEGESYEGIAVDSPVFAVINGLHAGDSFTVNGTEHRLDLVV
ncbi:hypothetical protein [Psychromicrobium xiongbiense]|uniref:hypothetical protein n=1 Tax=Psychromicrobium xiongbiense TaxID=3051184 RepID=UPI002553CF7B|nr:hypothetical protein [Psychromicrobium sp. YIM S02556]